MVSIMVRDLQSRINRQPQKVWLVALTSLLMVSATFQTAFQPVAIAASPLTDQAITAQLR